LPVRLLRGPRAI